jgi:hypothetical protein
MKHLPKRDDITSQNWPVITVSHKITVAVPTRIIYFADNRAEPPCGIQKKPEADGIESVADTSRLGQQVYSQAVRIHSALHPKPVGSVP